MTKFTIENLESLQRDFANGRFDGGDTPVERTTISDDVQPGLRAYVSEDRISFHVYYTVAGKGIHPVMYLGRYPEMTIDEARELAGKVRVLAATGVDPQEGLRERMIEEIRRMPVP